MGFPSITYMVAPKAKSNQPDEILVAKKVTAQVEFESQMDVSKK